MVTVGLEMEKKWTTSVMLIFMIEIDTGAKVSYN
jgi:hypothetical protein